MANINVKAGGNEVDVTFYDNYVPHLKAGEYSITIGQQLTGEKVADGSIPATPHPDVTQRFAVAGPRFTPLPPGMIHQPFPPNNATGVFEEYLPQLAFTSRELPWEREMGFQGDIAADAKYPWVALLVFTEDQLLVPATRGGESTKPTGQPKLSNPTHGATLPLNEVAILTSGNANGSWPGPPRGIRGPIINNLDPGQSGTDTRCRVIDISTSTFTSMVPACDDLPFLCHVRHVNTEHKEPQNTKDDGWFSAVIANRFCVGPGATSSKACRNIVHLVSLEGFEDLLKSGSDPSTPEDCDRIRLVSLFSWSFTCLREPEENFRTLMLNFLAPKKYEGLTLRMPTPANAPATTSPAQQEAVNRVHDGYVALSYAMRSGEESFAWYRGPFSPVATGRFLETTGADAADGRNAPFTASEAMIYSPTTGVFDQSYATAWSTGRLLALADKTFATNVLHWRRKAHRLVDLLLEHMRSPAHRQQLVKDGVIDASGNLTATGTKDLAGLLDGDLATTTFKEFLAGEFTNGIVEKIAQPGGANAQSLVVNTPDVTTTTPSDLRALMGEPAVTALLHQLSGLISLGKSSGTLSGTGVHSIRLAAAASQPVEKGAKLTITSPDKSTVAVVTTSAAVAKGDTKVEIKAFDFTAELPDASNVRIGAGDVMPSRIIEWLAQRALLYDVPFNNIIPDPRILPRESLRFFYIDRNWTDALLDGALSVGVQSSRDSLFHQLMRDPLHRAVDDILHQVRQKLRNAPKTGNPPTMGRMAGFIMRSAIVSGWPNLEVRAWGQAKPDYDNDPPMTPLRLDRVSANVLIGIFPDVPVALEFNEPSEGLVFGIEDEGIDMRYLPGMLNLEDNQPGNIIENPIKKTIACISIPRRRDGDANSPININGSDGLVSKMNDCLPCVLTPASFAVQMVRSPEQMLFVNPNYAKLKP